MTGLLNPASAAELARRVTSVVRADSRSGRLVRAVQVSPRIVPERVVKPRVVEGGIPSSTPVSANGFNALIDETARAHEVDPLLVHSVIQAESNYNPFAISPKGAQGMMQLIPSTARRFGVRNVFDPQQNVEGGVRYLKYLQTLFSDQRLVLAAYNAGEGAVARYGWIPPYPETENYVYRVGKKYGQALKAAGDKTASPRNEPPQRKSIEQFMDAEGRLHVRMH